MQWYNREHKFMFTQRQKTQFLNALTHARYNNFIRIRLTVTACDRSRGIKLEEGGNLNKNNSSNLYEQV